MRERLQVVTRGHVLPDSHCTMQLRAMLAQADQCCKFEGTAHRGHVLRGGHSAID